MRIITLLSTFPKHICLVFCSRGQGHVVLELIKVSTQFQLLINKSLLFGTFANHPYILLIIPLICDPSGVKVMHQSIECEGQGQIDLYHIYVIQTFICLTVKRNIYHTTISIL